MIQLNKIMIYIRDLVLAVATIFENLAHLIKITHTYLYIKIVLYKLLN